MEQKVADRAVGSAVNFLKRGSIMTKIFDEKILLDWCKLDHLNWKATVASIISTFFEESEKQYNDFRSNWRAHDKEGIRKSAHKLKSSCGLVGALLAYQILNQIETDIETGEAGIAELVEMLETVIPQSCSCLQEFKQSIQAD